MHIHRAKYPRKPHDKTTAKQQLNGEEKKKKKKKKEKNHVADISAFGCGVSVSSVWKSVGMACILCVVWTTFQTLDTNTTQPKADK